MLIPGFISLRFWLSVFLCNHLITFLSGSFIENNIFFFHTLNHNSQKLLVILRPDFLNRKTQNKYFDGLNQSS